MSESIFNRQQKTFPEGDTLEGAVRWGVEVERFGDSEDSLELCADFEVVSGGRTVDLSGLFLFGPRMFKVDRNDIARLDHLIDNLIQYREAIDEAFDHLPVIENKEEDSTDE